MTADLDLSPESVERLMDRLNGIYRIPITDGFGPAGGDEPDNPNEFVRRFTTAPIQQEAAATIRALADENARLRGEARRDRGRGVMTWDAHREFKERAAEARKALHYVCGDLSKRVPTVGKHEARNHEHLRRIYAEAKDEFPRFADTLAWLLWYDIIDSDRLAALTEPENARLRAERDAALQAGAEAMRGAAAAAAESAQPPIDRRHPMALGADWHDGFETGVNYAASAIRALPLPGQPKEGE